MKKKILNSGFAFLSLLLLASCQKQTPKALPAPEQNEEVGETNSVQGKPQPHKTINACWSDYFHECWPLVKCDCTILKEIVVKPKFTELIRTATDPNTVAQIFKDPENDYIASQLPSDHLESLQSGTYYVSIGSETATKICVFAGPSGPVNATNKAFVFQYDK